MTQLIEGRPTLRGDRPDQQRLARLLRPRSVAIVGAREDPRTRYLIGRMSAGSIDFFLVNPNRPELFGTKVYPTVRAIAAPVDAVLSLVNAEASLSVARDAAAVEAGGVVLGAAGFAEVGGAGIALQAELKQIALTAGMAIVGPNCLGFINAQSGAWISMTPDFPVRGGALSIVSHSGALLRPTMSAANQRRLGFSLLISAGNEAVTDMADYVEFLADDPATRVICLIVEGLRRPEAFFGAVDRAIALGKAVVSLRLARGERARAVAQSHTGALVSDGRTYDAAFQQHGIVLATDLDDLVDRAALLEQLPPERWVPVRGLGVITASGGGAGLISDLSEAEQVPLPELPRLLAPLRKLIPSLTTPNPLDMTGFAVGSQESVDAVFGAFAAEDQIDTDLVVWGLTQHDEAFGKTIIDGLLKHAAATSDRLHVVSAVEGSQPAEWTDRLRAAGIGIGHGLRGTLRGLATMRAVKRAYARSVTSSPVDVAPVARPGSPGLLVEEGLMLPFAAAMDLLKGAGIPTSPYVVLNAGDEVQTASIPFAGPYVAKLADVPHRTEVGAVRLGVAAGDLGAAIAGLRAIAERERLPPAVVIQPQVPVQGEAFMGISATDLGPSLIFGLGGTMVELMQRTAMRMAPFGSAEAAELLDELDVPQLFAGFRGQQPWDRAGLIQILVAAARLAAASTDWLDTLDINPLVAGPDGFVAVDCLCTMRRPGRR